MRVIFIRSYKKKLIGTGMFLLAWCLLFFILNVFLGKNFLMKITINDSLTFSLPIEFKVDNIFINEQNPDLAIETSVPFIKPKTEKFSTFSSIKGKFKFDYPIDFILSEKQFEGNEILYHIDLTSSYSHGFIQVWNLSEPLKTFLDNAKSTSQLNYKSFTEKPVTINNTNGFMLDYSFVNKSNITFKANELFLQKNTKVYRISYFMPQRSWNKKQKKIFMDIVNSLKIGND